MMLMVGLAFSLLFSASLAFPSEETIVTKLIQPFFERLSSTQIKSFLDDISKASSIDTHRILCSQSYKEGQHLAEALRNSTHEWSVRERVHSVHYDLDTVCFEIFHNSTWLSHNVNFTANIPIMPYFKIDTSMIEFLTTNSSQMDEKHVISVYYSKLGAQKDIINFYQHVGKKLSDAIMEITPHIIDELDDINWSHLNIHNVLTEAKSFIDNGINYLKPFISDLTNNILDTTWNTRNLRGGDAVNSTSATMTSSTLTKENLIRMCHFDTLKFQYKQDKVWIQMTEKEFQHNTQLYKACTTYLVIYLSKLSYVQLISYNTMPAILNYRARSIQQSSTVGIDVTSAPYTFSGLQGHGQIISIADTGLDDKSCYFSDSQNGPTPRSPSSKPVAYPAQRKVIQYAVTDNGGGDNTDNGGGHGTFVSGTAAGCIDSDNLETSLQTYKGEYDGVAPMSKIAFLDCSHTEDEHIITPDTAAGLYDPGYLSGARIHTNSWGIIESNFYDSEDVDNYLYTHQDMVIFFATGNSGMTGITTEAASKNVIAVGAGGTTYLSSSIFEVASYSSIGPAYDGRIKPDIISPGNTLQSAAFTPNAAGDTCNIKDDTGTSMSSPAAAGIAALIRQYLIDDENKFWSTICRSEYKTCQGFPGSGPSGVLVKAIILHSGTAMASDPAQDLKPPPSNQQGYGLITLSNVLPLPTLPPSTNDNAISTMVPIDFDLFIDDQVTLLENDKKEYQIHVEDSKTPLRVTISWYDPPAPSGSKTSALLHDLDLLVISPTTQHNYYGNGGDSEDRLNNNEQVTITTPDTGTYIVQVTSRALPHSGSQQFAIVITSKGYVEVGGRR